MKHGPEALRRLSTLLDRAFALAEGERDSFLAGLAGEDAALGPTLRELLARHASQETGDLLGRVRGLTGLGAPDDAGSAHAGDTVGPYRLERVLGTGGMGEVWLAARVDGALKRKVALKLPHVSWAPGLAERFAREREILSGLEHPHIARLYDAGVDPRGRPYMALEYVEGRPLDEFCAQRALPVEARLKLLLQVADAVAFAHGRLVVHRDLKPGNMLVTADGQVRLLDFGIAKLMEGDRTRETELTQVAGRALTLDYASPEQIRGEPIGTASDVYSLAVVAFQLLAGARPYRLKRESAAQLEEAIASVDAPLASEVAAEPALKRQLKGDLDAILNKALKKNPAERYATVDAFAQDLRRHLAGQSVAARPDTLAYRLLRFARNYRLPLAAAGIAVAVFVLALGFGATAVVIAALLAGLGAAVWQARRAGVERDRALALADRNSAVNVFLDTLLTKAARAGPLTALELLERSERLIENEVKGNADHRAFILGLIATLYSQIDHPTRSESLFRRALDVARDVSDPALRDSLASRLAVTAGRLGRVDEAVAAMEAILARRTTAPEVRAEVHAHRATIAKWNGDAPAALHHATEALRWFRAARHLPRRQEPVYLALLAWANHMNGRGDDADRSFEAAFAAFESFGLEDSPTALQYLINWGLEQQERGDLRRSLALFDRCLAAGERAAADQRPSPLLLANRAYTLAFLGRHAEAEAAYRASHALASQEGFHLMAYNIRMCIVELFAEQGRLADAEAELHAAEAERTFDVPEGSPATFARQIAEAQVAFMKNEPEASIAVYTAALETKRVAAGSVNALLGRAAAHEKAGRLEAARQDAGEALDLAHRLQGSKPWSFRAGLAHLALARVAAAAGDAGRAAREAAEAETILENTVDDGHPALAHARRLAGRRASAAATADAVR